LGSQLTQKSPIRHVNIFLFGLVGLTDVLYSVYVSTYICLDGSAVSVMVCDFDDLSVRSGVRISIVTFYFFAFRENESVSIYPQQDVKIH